MSATWAIADTLASLHPTWDFFVQMPLAPIVRVEGDLAWSSWTVSELANNVASARGYANLARYDDELVRAGEGWLTPLPLVEVRAHRPRNPDNVIRSAPYTARGV